MTKDQLKNACDLMGGQTAMSKLLKLKTPRYLRKVINEDAPIPQGWIIEVRELMAQRIQALNRLTREV